MSGFSVEVSLGEGGKGGSYTGVGALPGQPPDKAPAGELGSLAATEAERREDGFPGPAALQAQALATCRRSQPLPPRVASGEDTEPQAGRDLRVMLSGSCLHREAWGRNADPLGPCGARQTGPSSKVKESGLTQRPEQTQEEVRVPTVRSLVPAQQAPGTEGEAVWLGVCGQVGLPL